MSIWSTPRISTSSPALGRKSNGSAEIRSAGDLRGRWRAYCSTFFRWFEFANSDRPVRRPVIRIPIGFPDGRPRTVTSPPDITTFIETLWTERLPEAAKKAATVDDVLAMAATDAERCAKKVRSRSWTGWSDISASCEDAVKSKASMKTNAGWSSTDRSQPVCSGNRYSRRATPFAMPPDWSTSTISPTRRTSTGCRRS